MPAAAGQSPLQAKSYNEAVRGKRAGAAAVPALPSRWQQRQTHACVFRALDRRGRTDEWEAQPLIPPDHNKSLFSLRSVWESRAPYLIAPSLALSFQKRPLNPPWSRETNPSILFPALPDRPEIPMLNGREKMT